MARLKELHITVYGTIFLRLIAMPCLPSAAPLPILPTTNIWRASNSAVTATSQTFARSQRAGRAAARSLLCHILTVGEHRH